MLKVFGPNLGTVSGVPSEGTNADSLDRGTPMAKTPQNHSFLFQRTPQ